MRKLAGLFALLVCGGMIAASPPATAVDIPTNGSARSIATAAVGDATGQAAGATSTSRPAVATAPVARGECHDANGNDIPCPGTGTGVPSGTTTTNPGVPTEAQTAINNARTTAANEA